MSPCVWLHVGGKTTVQNSGCPHYALQMFNNPLVVQTVHSYQPRRRISHSPGSAAVASNCIGIWSDVVQPWFVFFRAKRCRRHIHCFALLGRAGASELLVKLAGRRDVISGDLSKQNSTTTDSARKNHLDQYNSARIKFNNLFRALFKM